MKHLPLRLSVFALIVSVLLAAMAAQQPAPKKSPDVIFVPTPHEVVVVMLRLAEVDREDLLYDLGCGDGRIPVAAAKQYGARAVCVDIDPQRIQEARENAAKAGVTERVKIVEGDLFDTDLRNATAVTLYLLTELNVRLRPKLLRELKPGTPVVSHDFHMGDWEPEEQLEVQGPARTHRVYKWRVPARAAGTWRWEAPAGPRRALYQLTLRQEVQRVEGTLTVDGREREVRNGRVTASDIRFEVDGDGVQPGVRFEGKVAGKRITGRMRAYNGEEAEWSATMSKPAEEQAAVAAAGERR